MLHASPSPGSIRAGRDQRVLCLRRGLGTTTQNACCPAAWFARFGQRHTNPKRKRGSTLRASLALRVSVDLARGRCNVPDARCSMLGPIVALPADGYDAG